MPTIEVSHKDLCKLIGKNIPVDKLSDDLLFAKTELDEIGGDTLKLDCKDVNRPDLWSAEGIAREIRMRYKPKFPEYKTEKPKLVVNVDNSVKNVRPLTVCAVVKNLKIDDNVLSQMIQLQEKVAGTFGRNRKEVAIGVYDLHKIQPPIRYTTVKPEGIKFIPLEFNNEMTPKEILEKHPKGKEFGHLLKDCNEYPIFIDVANNVLSLPPIINSDYTGKIDKNTKDVFIECSGFDFKFLNPALNVIVAALAERGGKIGSVEVRYGNKKIITPDLKPKKFSANADYVNEIAGIVLSVSDICNLLEKAGYKTKKKGKKINLLYPAYRQDIMHERDIIEDVLISYGYNKIEPVIPKLPTIGEIDALEAFSNSVAKVLVGLGLQEILSYTLTNKDHLFEKMCIRGENAAEIESPVSANWCVFRTWLLPDLLYFFSQNKHNEYPQNIFEIDDAVVLDGKKETRTRNVRKLAVALTDNIVSYEMIASFLDALMKNLDIKYEIKKHSHYSFINGRCGEIFVNNRSVGIIGEINPHVLNKWKLEKHVVAFELDISKMFEID
jgi:phenylalanyl-tRNA synthetase beta chain